MRLIAKVKTTMANIIILPGRQVYQCKVILAGSRPRVWRKFHVPKDYTLHKLHKVLQIVMGWEEYHLYEFQVDRTSYGEPHPDYGNKMKDSRSIKISQVANRTTKFKYIYDFGDGWQHEVLIQKILTMQHDVRYPVCLGGANACPPEDCGGMGGYGSFLRAIRNPAHKEHERMLDWIGGEFDPTTFDLERVNARLKRMKFRA